MASTIDWYERRDELMPGQMFRLRDGSVVRLDRRIPGDGTAWYADTWSDGWCHDDRWIEPCDLAELLPDAALAKAGA